MSDEADYPLGYSEHEAQRLAEQAALVEQVTQDVFLRAGLKPGMTVLDIGSGVGDVSLLASRMVGPEGAVLGIEKAASSVESARNRTAALGLDNVAFETADASAFCTERSFDAIVGRFVLSYIPDRSAVLRRLAGFLRPGGIFAFLEIDMTEIAQEPASDLFNQTRQWVLEGFAAGGAELSMGTKLYKTFAEAGLPPATMYGATPVLGGPDCGGYQQLVQALRSLAPVIGQNGIARVDAIELDTLAQRLRDDAAVNGRVVFMSRIVGAWTRLN